MSENEISELVYGKDLTQGIVSIETTDHEAILYFEGNPVGVEVPLRQWLIFSQKLSDKFQTLAGDQHYKYYMEYLDGRQYQATVKNCRDRKYDYFTKKGPEGLMLQGGYTYFKGLKVKDVSVLAFDIETNTGLEHNKDSMVLLIKNTLRRADGVIRKREFAYDQYTDQAQMLTAWCDWVCEWNPSIVCGHNILGYDLPFMQHVAKLQGAPLLLGRHGQAIKSNTYTSEFRKDGSQSYTYTDAHIYGREIVDTMFLSYKYDIARNYESYGLKQIIKQEGLEKPGRQFYDASQIGKNYQIPEEWAKIKKYAEDDADDALALYDLMIPSLFYYTQSVPMPLQRVVNTATGSQVNALMVRSYLQQGHSLPRASEPVEYEGGISFGNPGLYKHVYKVDVASLYPSIIRDLKIYDREKDPQGLFLKMVEYFTIERLNNKKLGKETGDRYYKDLEQAQKLVINSAYGFLGATGLIYNSPQNAALVTATGRRILQKAIDHFTFLGFTIVNADTDSVSYTSGKNVGTESFTQEIVKLNSSYPDLIRWENDGYYKAMLIVKAKNYATLDEKGKLKIKGAALKGTHKELALQKYLREMIETLIAGKRDKLFNLYQKRIFEIQSLIDITEWCFKKTVTKSVLKPERTNEQRVLDAVDEDEQSEGDKLYLFFKTDTELCLRENFDGTFDRNRLFRKLYKTLCVFESVVDVTLFPNYALKRNSVQDGESELIDSEKALHE